MPEKDAGEGCLRRVPEKDALFRTGRVRVCVRRLLAGVRLCFLGVFVFALLWKTLVAGAKSVEEREG